MSYNWSDFNFRTFCLYGRRDNRQLKALNGQLKARLERSFRRLTELENQHTQGGILQERMRQRIKQMDTHSLHSSSQVAHAQTAHVIITTTIIVMQRRTHYRKKISVSVGIFLLVCV